MNQQELIKATKIYTYIYVQIGDIDVQVNKVALRGALKQTKIDDFNVTVIDDNLYLKS